MTPGFAECPTGCIACSGSTCTECSFLYYWDTTLKECVYYCTYPNTVDYSDSSHGFGGACVHPSDTSDDSGTSKEVQSTLIIHVAIPIGATIISSIITYIVARKVRAKMRARRTANSVVQPDTSRARISQTSPRKTKVLPSPVILKSPILSSPSPPQQSYNIDIYQQQLFGQPIYGAPINSQPMFGQPGYNVRPL